VAAAQKFQELVAGNFSGDILFNEEDWKKFRLEKQKEISGHAKSMKCVICRARNFLNKFISQDNYGIGQYGGEALGEMKDKYINSKP